MVISHPFSLLLKYLHSLSTFNNLCQLVVGRVVIVAFFVFNFISRASLILYFKYQILLLTSPTLFFCLKFLILPSQPVFCLYSISLSCFPFIFLSSPFFFFSFTHQILIFPHLVWFLFLTLSIPSPSLITKSLPIPPNISYTFLCFFFPSHSHTTYINFSSFVVDSTPV